MKILLDCSEYQTPSQLDFLLRSAPDPVVGVYIKVTEDVTYRNHLADTFAAICEQHNTPYGYYHFATNNQMDAQAQFFRSFIGSLAHNRPVLKPMLDAEAPYSKGLMGVQHFQAALGTPAVLYANVSSMQQYHGCGMPLWVAQYDSMGYSRPQQGEIDSYKAQGFTLWQFTERYDGVSQDASVLLTDDLSALRAI